MPGSIVAVRVSEGDRVTAGTPVVVLESMKMQNEITAPVDGVVKRINCRVGDRVNLTDLLAEITAQEGNT
jgi:biotin carboxyl carrier protein